MRKQTKNIKKATAIMADGTKRNVIFCGMDELGNFLVRRGRYNYLYIAGKECKEIRIQIADTITVQQERMSGTVIYDRTVTRTGTPYRDNNGRHWIECRVSEEGGTAYAHYQIRIEAPFGWEYDEWITEGLAA
jgi:hypothetical protein